MTIDIGGEDSDCTIGFSHYDLDPSNGSISASVGESQGHLGSIVSATGLGDSSRLSVVVRTERSI